LHNPNAQLTRSTLQRTEYHIEKGALVRQSWDVLDQAGKSLPNRRILLPDVKELRFEYVDNKQKLRGTWPPAEKTKATLPCALRVTLTIVGAGTISQLYVIPVKIKESGEPLTT
jgi:general secretion pathway protein J